MSGDAPLANIFTAPLLHGLFAPVASLGGVARVRDYASARIAENDRIWRLVTGAGVLEVRDEGVSRADRGVRPATS